VNAAHYGHLAPGVGVHVGIAIANGPLMRTRVSGELMRETVLNRASARAEGRRREIKASETNENGYGKRGSAFGRIWETPNKPEAGMMEEDSVITGECDEASGPPIITQFLPICGEGNDQIRINSA
jgi:hypothetical protein